jgi:biopolymer transport protein ExbB/TolQ
METLTSPDNGMFLYLMLLCSAIILIIVVERIYYVLIRRRVNKDELVKEVLLCIETREIEGAIELCDRSLTPANQILGAGLRAYNGNFNHYEDIARNNTNSEITFSTTPDTHQREETIKRAMETVALGAFPKLRRRIGYLPMLSKIVCLIGVTGTVFGTMNVLGWEIANITYSSETLLAGISNSLFTTLLGLCIAIPTVVIHSFMSHKTLHMIEDAEEASRIILNALLKI